MDEIKKAKQFIEEAQYISILPSPQFQEDSFPAALGLFYILKNSGKNVNLLNDNHPERFNFLVDEAAVHHPKADFLISIKELSLI